MATPKDLAASASTTKVPEGGTVKQFTSGPSAGTEEKSITQQVKEIASAIGAVQEAIKNLCITQGHINAEVANLKTRLDLSVAPTTSTQPLQQPEPGQLARPHGNVVFNNTLDPAGMIEIAVVGGSNPTAFSFPDPSDSSGSKMLNYTFRMDMGKPKIGADGKAEQDENGNIVYRRKPAPHYYMPRMFASAQLRNDGGLKFVLVSPKAMTIERRSAKMNTESIEILADTEYQPPLFP
jgi:hypothetical protein